MIFFSGLVSLAGVHTHTHTQVEVRYIKGFTVFAFVAVSCVVFLSEVLIRAG